MQLHLKEKERRSYRIDIAIITERILLPLGRESVEVGPKGNGSNTDNIRLKPQKNEKRKIRLFKH